MAILTIFTPAYNRAHTIWRTYESLCRQTCKDFEWLIVDDGSSDNTKELVNGWVLENKIPIRYIYQQNQGMHGAHNTAYKNIHTELNTCIDSDDYMPDDAVEKIVSFWREKGSDRYAGLIGLDIDTHGSIIGSKFPDDLKTTTLTGFYDRGGRGDKKLVYRTDVVNSYPEYPIFEGEKYVGLSAKYIMIDREWELLVSNQPFVIVEYQQDGSSMNMYRQYKRNPQGFVYLRKIILSGKLSFSNKVRHCCHYIANKLLAKQYNIITDSPAPIATFFMLPFGIMWYIYIQYKNIVFGGRYNKKQ